MTVNLTTMLVMTTIFIAVMDKLPSTAYIKMIDIWLIFGQLIPFARVVITTVMEQLRNGSDRLVNHHSTAMELDMGNTPINVIGIGGTDEKLSTRHQLALACGSTGFGFCPQKMSKKFSLPQQMVFDHFPLTPQHLLKMHFVHFCLSTGTFLTTLPN